MSKKLDIDDRVDLWMPAFNALRFHKDAQCPLCNGTNLNSQIKRMKGNIGFVLITCNDCGKSGYFSRVDLTSFDRETVLDASDYDGRSLFVPAT